MKLKGKSLQTNKMTGNQAELERGKS
jgi:hypothetical protein